METLEVIHSLTGVVLAAPPTEAEGLAKVQQELGLYWPKLTAQLISFSIFIGVLWWAAYKPVLNLLEERRKRIADSIENADRVEKEVAEAEEKRKEILREANAKAEQMIEEAVATAKANGEKKIQEAVAQADAIVKKAEAAIEADREKMISEAKQEIATLVVSTTGKVIDKVLTDEDRKRLNEETLKELAA